MNTQLILANMTQDQPPRLDHIETWIDIRQSIATLIDFSLRQAQQTDKHAENLARLEVMTTQNAMASAQNAQNINRLEKQISRSMEAIRQSEERTNANMTQLTLLMTDFARQAAIDRKQMRQSQIDSQRIWQYLFRQSGKNSSEK